MSIWFKLILLTLYICCLAFGLALALTWLEQTSTSNSQAKPLNPEVVIESNDKIPELAAEETYSNYAVFEVYALVRRDGAQQVKLEYIGLNPQCEQIIPSLGIRLATYKTDDNTSDLHLRQQLCIPLTAPAVQVADCVGRSGYAGYSSELGEPVLQGSGCAVSLKSEKEEYIISGGVGQVDLTSDCDKSDLNPNGTKPNAADYECLSETTSSIGLAVEIYKAGAVDITTWNITIPYHDGEQQQIAYIPVLVSNKKQLSKPPV